MRYKENYHFFKDKRVLVTGHTGFVGAWLCAVLDYFGAETIGFSWREEKGSLYEKIKDDIKVKNYYGDLRSETEIKECMEQNKPDIIFHLAAYGFIQDCKKNPYTAFSSNVMGTVNLLEAVKDSPSVKTIVLASSDKVYRNDDITTRLFEEEDALGGVDPYSCSKTCEDLIAQSYYETYLREQNKSMVILRPSNIIGGGDHNMTRLIPSIIESVINGKEMEIRNPNAIRPWQYILDAIDAYMVSAMKIWDASSVQIWNVGPTQENITSVGEIAQILGDMTGENKIIFTDNPKSHLKLEKKYLGLNINKIKDELDWKPCKNLEETLRDTYNFYKECEEIDSYRLCQKYIEAFYREI